jgi:hypothetical protein
MARNNKGNTCEETEGRSTSVMALITTDRITRDEIAETDRSVSASRAISYGGSVYGVGAAAGTLKPSEL